MSTLELLQKKLLLLVCPPGSDFMVEPLIVLKVPEDLKLLHHVKVTAHGEDSNTVTSRPLEIRQGDRYLGNNLFFTVFLPASKQHIHILGLL